MTLLRQIFRTFDTVFIVKEHPLISGSLVGKFIDVLNKKTPAERSKILGGSNFCCYKKKLFSLTVRNFCLFLLGNIHIVSLLDLLAEKLRKLPPA